MASQNHTPPCDFTHFCDFTPQPAKTHPTDESHGGAARQHGGAGPWGICPGIMTRCVTFPQWPYVLGARYVLPAGREPGRRGHAVYTLLRCARAGGLERWSSRLATVVSDGGGVGVFGRHTDHRGRHTVEDTLWKTRCGRRAVEDALWKTRCGRRAVEDALWKTRRPRVPPRWQPTSTNYLP
jgi:hypothetical protein